MQGRRDGFVALSGGVAQTSFFPFSGLICSFLIIRSSSMPPGAFYAASNDLYPNMSRVIRLTPRWSCSTKDKSRAACTDQADV